MALKEQHMVGSAVSGETALLSARDKMPLRESEITPM